MNTWEVRYEWKYVGIPASNSTKTVFVGAVTMEQAHRKVKAHVHDYKDQRLVRFESVLLRGELIS